MSKLLVPPAVLIFKSSQDEAREKLKKEIRLVKATSQVGHSLAASHPEKAISQAIVAGIKMAGDSVFHDSLSSPFQIADGLKRLGVQALTWSPEILMAEIDHQFKGWDADQMAEAIEHFRKTGVIKTEVPQLVREKIYAIRVVATSNSAQTEWHIFEKVGGAFNDRVAKFGSAEPLSALECAQTVAVIEDIRPDSYENEIKIYIAACAHTDGLYTVLPVKWLAMAEIYLQQMNFESTGTQTDPGVRQEITEALKTLRIHKNTLRELSDDLVSVQAAKLLSIEESVKET